MEKVRSGFRVLEPHELDYVAGGDPPSGSGIGEGGGSGDLGGIIFDPSLGGFSISGSTGMGSGTLTGTFSADWSLDNITLGLDFDSDSFDIDFSVNLDTSTVTTEASYQLDNGVTFTVKIIKNPDGTTSTVEVKVVW